MRSYKVVEMFTSINGEGQKAGQLSVFIRFQGCNLACAYCDTSWANEENAGFTWMTAEEITDYIVKTKINNVTITGGEPLMVSGIKELLILLSQQEFIQVEIETNGSVALEEFLIEKNPPSFTMDYKLPGSGMEEQMNLSNFNNLKKTDTVKFVVSGKEDLLRSREVILQNQLNEKCRVYLSPVFGKIELEEMVAFLMEYKMNDVTMQLQMHKIIWNPEKRGV